MSHALRWAALTPVVLVSLLGSADPPPKPTDGKVKGEQALAGLRIPDGMSRKLFAHDPDLSSPVAISVDYKGRVFVAEEYRFNQGTEENRTRAFFLEDDLQIRSTAERLKMYEKHSAKFEGGMKWFTKHSDKVRLLVDRDCDGKCDKSTLFADGFNEPLDGLAAGVLAWGDDVYLTNIPHLWRLRDTKNVGVADAREKLLSGFGVNCAFLGHDLHGLTFGPDGRLYFSVGDRGYNVTSKEGKEFVRPRTGAVFRCEPDGTKFEVVHTGLRNPQELAFDQFGNLFADDNNCDKGDHARLVWIVEGGESGWNMAYQTITPHLKAPWFSEKMWHLAEPDQPGHIVPPVGKIGAGPSGFCFTSGISLGERYRDSFLMANYTGNGGIESFKVKPKGASFEIDDYHDFAKPVQATDVEVGPDGVVYISDFVNLLWNGGSAGGRIFALSDEKGLKKPEVAEAKKLIAEGFRQRKADELLRLLGHAEYKVRQRAQFELAARGKNSVEALTKVATGKGDRFARIHAIWALGQIERRERGAVAGLMPLAEDADEEIRIQAARVFGDNAVTAARGGLEKLLADPSLRVRFHAATALSRAGSKESIAAVKQMLAENNDADPYLRHAGAMVLAAHGDANKEWETAGRAWSRAWLAAARRNNDFKVAVLYLANSDPVVRADAARAVLDGPAEGAPVGQAAYVLPQLVKLATAQDEPTLRRLVELCLRGGSSQNFGFVLDAATSPNVSELVREECLNALKEWAAPGPRDRVTGVWRPCPPREAEFAGPKLLEAADALLAATPPKLLPNLIAALKANKADLKPDVLAAMALDAKRPEPTRLAALRWLREAKPELGGLKPLRTDPSPAIRAEAREMFLASAPAEVLGEMRTLVARDDSSPAEIRATLRTLASMKHLGFDELRKLAAARLSEGKVPPELWLDVVELLKATNAPSGPEAVKLFENGLAKPGDALGALRVSLHGGDAEAGRDIFRTHAQAQCVRCHIVAGQGGDAGPKLDGLSTRYPKEQIREHVLEAMLEPSVKLAPGYGTVTLNLTSGAVVTGTIQSEDAAKLVVLTGDKKTLTISPKNIEDRSKPTSPMPSVRGVLTPRELRDLVEYLAGLK